MSSDYENQAAANVKRVYTPTPWRRKPSLTVFSSLSDVASVTGVAGPATVANWRTRLVGFPTSKASGKFDLVEVVEWMRDHGPRRTDVRDIPVSRVWRYFAAAYQDASGVPPSSSRATMVALVLLRHALVRMRVHTDGGLDWEGLVNTVLQPNFADAPLWVPFADYLRVLAGDLEAADPRLQGLLVQQLTVHGNDALHLMDLVDLLDRIEPSKSERALDDVMQLDPERSLSTRSSGRRLAALAVGMARLQEGRSLLDPAMGEGTVLSAAWRKVGPTVQLFGQELDPAVWTTVRSRLLIEGVEAELGDQPADSIRDDQHAAVRADAVVIDPPLGDNAPALDRWIEFGLSHLAPGGRVVMVLPLHDFVTVRTVRRRPQERMRKMFDRLLADDLVEGILVVPSRLRSDIVGPSMMVSLRPGSGPVVQIVSSEADGGALWVGSRLSELAETIRTEGLEFAGGSVDGLRLQPTPAHRVFQVLEAAASVRPRSGKPADVEEEQRVDSIVADGYEPSFVRYSMRTNAPPEMMPARLSQAAKIDPGVPARPGRPAFDELLDRVSELTQAASRERSELARLREGHADASRAVLELLQLLDEQRPYLSAEIFRRLRTVIRQIERALR